MPKNKKRLFLVGLYVAIAVVGLYTVWHGRKLDRAMDGIYVAALGQVLGPTDAPKTIVEFLDYRCSYCRETDAVIQDLLQSRSDVKIVIRHYPVFGRPSIIEAEVALAAAMQGKFAEAHAALIRRTEPITDREVDDLGRSLGLNMQQFHIDMKGPEIGYLLLNTLDTVETLGINSTPTFVVGDIIYTFESGLPDVETFNRLLKDVYGE